MLVERSRRLRAVGVLPPGQEEEWLAPALPPARFQALCAPLPAGAMEAWTISRRITSRTRDPNVPEVASPVHYPELDAPVGFF